MLGVFAPVTDFGWLELRGDNSSFAVVESGPLRALDSTVAPAALDFSFGASAPSRGTIVRPCSVTDVTADV